MRTKFLGVLALAIVAFALPAQAADTAPKQPDNFPRRPINLVVSYPAGGGMDITARTLAREMERVTGYQFRVQNRGGGGSIVGNTYVAKQAKADGYTIGILANPTLFINILGQGAHFEKDDIVPIAGITFAPVVWATRTKSKFGDMTFQQILEKAEKNPKEIKVGVIPNGAFDMATRIVQKQTNAEFTIVPFQGGKPAIVSLLGGNIDVSTNYYSEIAQYLKEGSMKALAVSDNEPAPQLPDTPTMKDLNIDMAPGTWGADRFAAVPKGTPKARQEYLAYLIQKTLKDEKTHEAFKEVGIELAPISQEQEAERYDEAYSAVHDFLKSSGDLKQSD